MFLTNQLYADSKELIYKKNNKMKNVSVYTL